jgi:DNA-binding response OmpR family regulator
MGGLTVEAVMGGWQALMFALLCRPSLVILDLNLPGLDGEDVVAGLQVAYGADIPVLVVSDRRRISPRARRISAYAALATPFRPEDLRDAVHQGLGDARRAASRRGVPRGGGPAGRLGGMRGAARSTPDP